MTNDIPFCVMTDGENHNRVLYKLGNFEITNHEHKSSIEGAREEQQKEVDVHSSNPLLAQTLKRRCVHTCNFILSTSLTPLLHATRPSPPDAEAVGNKSLGTRFHNVK
jgi:hypothetical protein